MTLTQLHRYGAGIALAMALGVPRLCEAWEAPLPAELKGLDGTVRVTGAYLRYEGQAIPDVYRSMPQLWAQTCKSMKRPLNVKGDPSGLGRSESMVYVSPTTTTARRQLVSARQVAQDLCNMEVFKDITLQQYHWNGTHTVELRRDVSSGKVSKAERVGKMGLLPGLPVAVSALSPNIQGHRQIQGIRCAVRDEVKENVRIESCALDDDRVQGSLQGYPLQYRMSNADAGSIITDMILVEAVLDALIPKEMSRPLEKHPLFKP